MFTTVLKVFSASEFTTLSAAPNPTAQACEGRTTGDAWDTPYLPELKMLTVPTAVV